MFLPRSLVHYERYEGNGDDGVLLLLDGKGCSTATSKPFVDDGVFGELVESVRHVMHPRFRVLDFFHNHLIFNCLQESSIICQLQLDLRFLGGGLFDSYLYIIIY